MHPVHDIEVSDDVAAYVPAVIEIPRGSHLKYEVDKPTGMLRLDRVLYSAVFYPANYGFIPRTYCDKEVQGLVTVRLQNVPWREALEVTVRQVGATVTQQERNILLVEKAKTTTR